MKARTYVLWPILTMLTLLFIAAQIAFFSVHYQVTELVDALIDRSLGHALLETTFLVPLISFFGLQLIAYMLLIMWLHFMATEFGHFRQYSARSIYWLGLVLWVLACYSILSLNHYFYPDSFFAFSFGEFEGIGLIVSLSILLLLTVLAYIHFFYQRRYNFSGILLLLLLILVGGQAAYDKWQLSHLSKAATPPLKQPNIILIGIDSLRPDFLSSWQPYIVQPNEWQDDRGVLPKTPQLNQFFKQASLLTHTYAPLARTFPSWLSLLTAKYPLHHHGRNNLASPSLTADQDTLAKKLQTAGYETFYASDEKRFSNISVAYGFDYIIGPKMGVLDFILGGLSDFPLANLLINLPVGRWLFPYNYANRAANITYQPDHFLKLVKLHLLQHDPSKPAFIAVHFCLTHWPFTFAPLQPHFAARAALPQIELYKQSIAIVDRQVGELLQSLKSLGLLEHAIVMLLSDHGTTFGLNHERIIAEENYVGDAHQLQYMTQYKKAQSHSALLPSRDHYTISTTYGQGTDVLSLKQNHIVLAVRGFGRAQFSHLPILSQHTIMDIAPTILDYLQLEPFTKSDGRSFLAELYAPFFCCCSTTFFY